MLDATAPTPAAPGHERVPMGADVAVIVRTKDRPLLLERALRSIDAQTVAPSQLVVVNDGGDAAAVEEALEPVRGTIAGEVIVVHHDAPVGRPRGMNVGVRASTASAFVFHDDDDSWAPAFLERTFAHLAEHDDAAVATRTAVVFERVEGETITELERAPFQPDVTAVTLIDTLYRNSTPPICLVYRREAYDRVGGYDDSLTALADWDFLLRVLRVATVGFIDGEPLAFWHHRRDDISPTGNSAYADAGAHTAFNRGIRDGYLRRSLPEADDLGIALFVADGFRRIDEKADAARAEASRVADERANGHGEHVEAVHASIVQQLQASHAAIERLEREVAALREQVAEGFRSPVRAAGGKVVRGIRSGFGRLRGDRGAD